MRRPMLGLSSPDLAAGIRRVKGAKKLGVNVGNWLTANKPADCSPLDKVTVSVLNAIMRRRQYWSAGLTASQTPGAARDYYR